MWDPGPLLGWGEAVHYLHIATAQKAVKKQRLLARKGWEEV